MCLSRSSAHEIKERKYKMSNECHVVFVFYKKRQLNECEFANFAKRRIKKEKRQGYTKRTANYYCTQAIVDQIIFY